MSNLKQKLDDLKKQLDIDPIVLNNQTITKTVKTPIEPKLNDKKMKFIDEYIRNGFNGKEAAIYAGYSKDTATIKASNLLKEVLLKEELEKRKAKIKIKHEIDLDFIVNQYLAIIESSQMNGQDGLGTIHDRKEWLNSVKALATMVGLDQPKKLDITSNGESININYIIPTIIEEEETEDDNE